MGKETVRSPGLSEPFRWEAIPAGARPRLCRAVTSIARGRPADPAWPARAAAWQSPQSPHPAFADGPISGSMRTESRNRHVRRNGSRRRAKRGPGV